MSTEQPFKSFGLEENIQDDKQFDKKTKDIIKNKKVEQSVNNNQSILNFRDEENSIFFSNKPTVPILTERIFTNQACRLKKIDCLSKSNQRRNENQGTILNESPKAIEPNMYIMRTKTNALNSRFLVKAKEMREFFKLTEDPVINDFLKMDSCKRIADKSKTINRWNKIIHHTSVIDLHSHYLIAMVFAYFKRAGFTVEDYNRTNFFVALYLANDVEEDEEEIKFEILPWAIGKQWRETYVDFLKKRDLLFRRIEYKAIISRKCCDEIINIEPSHSLWKRERCLHHGGAVRGYMKDPRDNGIPRGPDADPFLCPECDATDSQYDSGSSDSLCWLISPHESFGGN